MSATDRAARTASADELCRTAYDACGGPEAGVALVAVGGYGRGELAPCSDLDLVLVHEQDTAPGGLATDLWYPLWDSGRRIDHAVRSLPGMVDAAADLKVALGLLDSRHVAGDPALTLRLRTTMLADWRRQARTRLPELRVLGEKRHAVLGELAHAAVPDLKEAEGGLRDAGVLRALEASWLVDASTPALEVVRRGLLDARDELHAITGRPGDRVPPEAWAPLAERLGLPDADRAQRHVRSLGRRVTHLSRLTWRRTDAVLARPAGERGRRTPALVPVAPGVALSRGEVVLDTTARPSEDPTLLLRAAAEAAVRDVPLAPTSAARLARECADLPVPWPPDARDALVRLLASGGGLLPVWETLEETGGLDRFLPEWERVRLLPHASAIHRFTVDRHVVETCAEAGVLIRTVARPDLLLVSALLHDIGKGGTHDHSAAGEPVARAVATRMGFTAPDVALVALLVRRHLLLATLATTRDPDDPATAAELVSHVAEPEALHLLRALTEADAKATAPAAWTTWRASLVDRLTANAVASLDAGPEETNPCEEWELPGGGDGDDLDVTVARDGSRATVRVVAPDRVGLLADVAGALARLRAPVLAAHAWTQPGPRGEGGPVAEWACSVWEVAEPGIDAGVLRDRIRRAAETGVPVQHTAPVRPGALPPVVEVRADASRGSTVLEVRMEDRPGVLHRVLAALAGLELTVASAHLSTLGPQAVDVFYVQEQGGVRPGDERAAAAAHAVRRALET